jgi:hypothetical protein
MFERIKKINGHEYRYLVKSVRVDGKIKQKVIKYLGKADPLEVSGGEGTDTAAGRVQSRKKVTFQDIVGLIKTEGLPDAVELKRKLQRGEKI